MPWAASTRHSRFAARAQSAVCSPSQALDLRWSSLLDFFQEMYNLCNLCCVNCVSRCFAGKRLWHPTTQAAGEAAIGPCLNRICVRFGYAKQVVYLEVSTDWILGSGSDHIRGSAAARVREGLAEATGSGLIRPWQLQELQNLRILSRGAIIMELETAQQSCLCKSWLQNLGLFREPGSFPAGSGDPQLRGQG